ncbi:hypothetical protein C9374_001610 [Naegleria lovaniensis]|uniref:Uncharacterized protein n=1 Tax=Naegleria lovaniensis TaxID=51637 RepID=A0AA88KM45_NAELO|nr:uncharacterized protein C9374_001610 [Naegleria lovaniensis]KAG2387278.1 hypothetical protein C9374_001610 [Naegleria lovaniensis]
MKEDCTELYWDRSAIVSKGKTNPLELFFKILNPFKKLKVIVLKNETVDIAFLKTILVDWKGEVKHLKFINCMMSVFHQLPIQCKFMTSDSSVERSFSGYVPLQQFFGGKVLECQFITEKMKAKTVRRNYGYLNGMDESESQEMSVGCQRSCVEEITIISTQTHMLSHEHLLCCFCLLKEFPKLRLVELSFMSANVLDSVIESMGGKELFPNVEFKKNIHSTANQILMDTQDFEKAIDYYMSRFEKDFHFRKNRLEAFRKKYLTSRSSFDTFHNNACKIIDFFSYHSPFGMDSKLKDMNGYNIIQLAIIFSSHATVEFILRYLTALENESVDIIQIHNELQELFWSNNGIDGKNAVFSSIPSKDCDDLLRTMMQYNISFNAPSSDGSTIAHYLCHVGKLEQLKNIWFSLFKDLPLERKLYFLDLNSKNHMNEYPIEVCKKLKMNNMMNYLKENSQQFGISYLPNLEVEKPTSSQVTHKPLPVQPPAPSRQNTQCQIL